MATHLRFITYVTPCTQREMHSSGVCSWCVAVQDVRESRDCRKKTTPADLTTPVEISPPCGGRAGVCGETKVNALLARFVVRRLQAIRAFVRLSRFCLIP